MGYGDTLGMQHKAVDAPATLEELAHELSEARRGLELARESEKRFRILNELTNAYCFVAHRRDDALAVEWVTGAFTRITGYEPDELRGAGIWSIVCPADRARVAHELHRVIEGETVVH